MAFRQHGTATPAPKQGPDRKALIFILMTAFLNLAGIGLIGPVAPFLVAEYVARADDLAVANGLLFTSFSLFQFLAVPGLGALSDRFGRRPVLLLCLLGSAAGYLVFGIGGALWVLFLGRIVDGITGGNLGAIYAYVADLTEPYERARYYGLLGAVSAFGFIIGPALGAFLAANFGGPTAPVYFAAAVAFLNAIWGWFAMPESLPASKRIGAIRIAQLNPFTQLLGVFRLSQLRLLLIAIFCWALAFAVLQSNLAVLAKDSLNWRAADVSGGFAIFGVIGILVQGGLIRRLVSRFGEIRVAISGTLLLTAGFALLALIPAVGSSWFLLMATAVCAFGNGLVTPTLTALTSQVVGPHEQGRVQGGSQSVQAFARVIGPLWAGGIYVSISMGAPYWSGAGMFAVTGLCIIAAIPVVRAARAQREAAVPYTGG